MFPYEILVGFRRTMCVCARGHIGNKKLLKKLDVDVNNFSSISKVISRNSFSLLNNRGNINKNHVKRLHTQLLANCQIPTNDSKLVEFHNISALCNDLNDDDPLIELKDRKRRKSRQNYINLDASDEDIMKNVPESVKTWLFSESEKAPSRDIEKKFPEPRAYLHNIFTVVTNETKISHCLSSSSRPIDINKKRIWSYTYEIKWPERKLFSASGHSKASAAQSAATKVLYWLHLNNRIRNRMPIVYKKDETSSIINTPEEFSVDSNILNKIDNFLSMYEKGIKEMALEPECSETFKVSNSTHEYQHPISHLRVDYDSRNKILKERLENRNNIVNPNLPVFKFRSQIITELENNQALVIKGDTGCGKTTQVPQFILDSMSEKGIGGDCSMVVTQPRRLSAISLAQRIAYERNEEVGDVVGYQVRLQQILPKQNGSILFCTTGVLLKKMQNNLRLNGCSHVIIDEAHERSVDTDLLLALLKRSMKMNPSLKVIIMSATINADLFQEYLNCNSLEIPGKLFPVEMNFLEDITRLGISPPQNLDEDDNAHVNCESIVELIRYISEKKPPGAILCFLPGWYQIKKIQDYLENRHDSNLVLIPLHSRIPYETQSKIFKPVSDGCRKVILATDIAETGITVPDVVYVIDSACRKETRWHENKGLSSIDVHWVSQANVNQRKGRAGRVQKGESYHFITKQTYEELDPYPIPEVLRVSLEKTVLDCKVYSDEKPQNFLVSMPQPPRLTSVKKAVSDLQTLGALDADENLTHLGKRIAHFSIHPKLSKAMVYATIFQCLQPVTTISTALSIDSDLFYGMLDNKSRTRGVKQRFHPTSDHLSIAWIYSQWLSYFNKGFKQGLQFCKKNNIHAERMLILHKMRDSHLDCLRQTGLIEDVAAASNLENRQNEFSVLDELVRGILLAGMDQLLKHRNFEFKKGRFSKSGTSMVTEDDARAQLTPECVNYKRSIYPSPYMTYYQKTHHDEMRTTLIRESSMISPITVLLFSQGRVTGFKYEDGDDNSEKLLLQISGKKNLNLLCDEHTASKLLRFRDAMWSIIRYYVVNNVDEKWYDIDDSESNNIVNYKKNMLDILANLLSSASSKIDSIETTDFSFEQKNFTNSYKQSLLYEKDR